MTPALPASPGRSSPQGCPSSVGATTRPAPPPTPVRARARTGNRVTKQTRALLLAGLAVGVLVALATGWFVAVLVAPAALAGLPLLLSAPPAGKEVKRLEAMEDWIRSLSGVLTAGAGLEQALISSAAVHPRTHPPRSVPAGSKVAVPVGHRNRYPRVGR